MRNYIAFGTFAFATSLLVGCANEPPKCSDPATLSLAKTIVCKEILVAMVDPECKAVSLQHARPLRYDAAIKKLTCTANLVIPRAGHAGVDTPMKYESQLDEQGRQVVAVYELSEDGQNRLQTAMLGLEFARQAKEYEDRDRLRAAQTENQRALVPTTTKASESPSNSTGFASLVGRGPGEALENPALKGKLQSLLKADFLDFVENLVVSSPTELQGEYFFGSGCKRHLCAMEAGAYAVNVETGATYAAMLSGGDSIKLFGSSAAALPPPLRQWYRENGGKE